MKTIKKYNPLVFVRDVQNILRCVTLYCLLTGKQRGEDGTLLALIFHHEIATQNNYNSNCYHQFLGLSRASRSRTHSLADVMYSQLSPPSCRVNTNSSWFGEPTISYYHFLLLPSSSFRVSMLSALIILQFHRQSLSGPLSGMCRQTTNMADRCSQVMDLLVVW